MAHRSSLVLWAASNHEAPGYVITECVMTSRLRMQHCMCHTRPAQINAYRIISARHQQHRLMWMCTRPIYMRHRQSVSVIRIKEGLCMCVYGAGSLPLPRLSLAATDKFRCARPIPDSQPSAIKTFGRSAALRCTRPLPAICPLYIYKIHALITDENCLAVDALYI